MVAKIVEQERFCQECTQKHDCKKIYEQLGNTQGPSVVFKVVAAFVLPLIIFIAALAVFRGILVKTAITKEIQTLLGFLLALLVTFVGILIIKMVYKQLSRNR